MVKIIQNTLIIAVMLFSGCLIYAQEWVIDNAQVLDLETKNQIEASLSQLNAKTRSHSYIVTERTIRQPEMVVADDLFDQLTHYSAGQNIEGTLLLIVTEDAAGFGRRVHLSTSGDTTIDHISEHKKDQLLDRFANDMRGHDNYNQAVKNYVIQLDKELTAPLTSTDIAGSVDQFANDTHGNNNYNQTVENYVIQSNKKLTDSPLTGTDIAGGGLASLLSGLLTFFCILYHYRLPERPIPALWKNNTVSEVQHSNNELIDSSTRFRIIPTPNKINSGGGSHTHIGSSGNRHGGGGRGF